MVIRVFGFRPRGEKKVRADSSFDIIIVSRGQESMTFVTTGRRKYRRNERASLCRCKYRPLSVRNRNFFFFFNTNCWQMNMLRASRERPIRYHRNQRLCLTCSEPVFFQRIKPDGGRNGFCQIDSNLNFSTKSKLTHRSDGFFFSPDRILVSHFLFKSSG